MRRRGFTLLEALIAIAIGMIVVLTTWEGFRVASQCVTAARRLSLQNAVLRAGFEQAHEFVDDWTDLDDPRAGGAQWLRQTSAGDGVTQGLPFTPFPSTSSASTAGEAARGWDPRYKWPANDPRGWQRANTVESMDGDLRLGRYAIFSATDASLDARSDPAQLPTGAVADYGTVAVAHTWLANQQRDLMHALQFYGACAYLPANQLFGYHRPWLAWGGMTECDESTDAGGIPLLFGHWGSAFVNWDGSQLTIRGLWRLTQGSAYAIARPDGSPGTSRDALLYTNHARWNVGYGADVASMADYQRATLVPQALLPLAPSAWPVGSVAVQRYVKSRRFVALAHVRWIDPASGETVGVAFSTYGTDLRGARQQRRPDVGWATWDDVGGGATNDATLDGAAP